MIPKKEILQESTYPKSLFKVYVEIGPKVYADPDLDSEREYYVILNNELVGLMGPEIIIDIEHPGDIHKKLQCPFNDNFKITKVEKY